LRGKFRQPFGQMLTNQLGSVAAQHAP
jgi:hypothetical protein